MDTEATLDQSKAPRLLLISSEFPPGPGGIGTHAHQLACHLHRRDWAVQVLSPQPYVTAAERAAFNARLPFHITPLPERTDGIGWPVARVQAVIQLLRSFRPSVIVATGRRSLWTAAIIHQRTKIPWLAVGHGSEFNDLAGAEQLMTSKAINSASTVVAVSRYTAGLIRDIAAPRRIEVIPNAADGERFKHDRDTRNLLSEWGLEGRRVLLTVGQVSERKAQDTVIRALPMVLPSCPNLIYLMAGLPTRQAEFAALAAELGVADHIRFTGVVPEELLPTVYHLADLFVLVSRRTAEGDVEGYGIVVQEAALSGVPAVVSRDCGLTEAIQEEITGISVPPDDPAATATAIARLLADEELRRRMGTRAREAALATTWSERGDEYDRLLRGLVATQPQPSRR